MIDPAEFCNLLVGAGLLVGELVARESDNNQTLVLVLLVEGLESVVLRCESTLGSCINYEQNLPFVLREVYFYAFVIERLNLYRKRFI